MPAPLRLAVCGARGRMGSEVSRLAAADRRFRLVAGLARGDDLADALSRVDTLVDFTAPEASLGFARAAAAARKRIVIGTTGFTDGQQAALSRLARRTAVFLAPNFSPGMNVLCRLAHIATAALPGYEADIVETHHARKKDAPSGSAKRLADAVLAAGRPGVTIESRREGEVVGEHVLTLSGPDESLRLSHGASSREVFARGALEAALWLRSRGPGLYDMRRMLSL